MQSDICKVICIASPGPGLVAAFAAQEESPGYRKRLEYVASLTALEVSHHEHPQFCQLYGSVPLGCRPYTCFCVLSLMLLQTGVSLTVSVLSCTVYYLAKAPTHFSLRFALSVALLFAASLTVCRTLLLERKHQVSLHLAMPASTTALIHAHLSLCMVSLTCMSSF